MVSKKGGSSFECKVSWLLWRSIYAGRGADYMIDPEKHASPKQWSPLYHH